MSIIDQLASYWPPDNIATSLGAPQPGSTSDDYNYYTLQLWTCTQGPLHISYVWSSPTHFFTTSSSYGSTDA